MAGFVAGEWPVDYAGVGCSVFTGDSGAPDQSVFEAMAVDMLWNWTGRIYSTYDVTVRPCREIKPIIAPPSSFEGSGPWQINPGFGSGHSTIGFNVGSWMPVLVNGQWFNIRCGSCGNAEGCDCLPDQMKSLRLPEPVNSISNVTIDGATLDPSLYMLEDSKWLIRTDGNPWPVTQQLELPLTQPNTWSVTYNHGLSVPVAGQVAAGTLACELAKAAIDDEDCQLPSRITSVVREGISMTRMDPFAMPQRMPVGKNAADMPHLTTGIWAIDSWLASATVARPYAAVRGVDTLGTARWRYSGA